MIAYAVQAGRRKDLEAFRRYAAPGLARTMRRGDRLRIVRGRSIHAGYNNAMNWAQHLPGVEALVLLHADAQIIDGAFPEKIRQAFRDPAVVVAGVCGAAGGVDSLLWWTKKCLGGVMHEEGQPFAFHSSGNQEADIVDGVLIALSPWALHYLAFDHFSYLKAPWYGYDVDICFSARAWGKRVRVIDTLVQHHTAGGLKDPLAFVEAEKAFQGKWFRHG